MDDSDTEIYVSDVLDNAMSTVNSSPFPNECLNETDGIEYFYKCFERRYEDCPALFAGSLQKACQSAFNSNIIKERRPVLVYIHNDKSLFTNLFCSKIFCSTVIIDYLLENYIVWSWDITLESNRIIIKNVWNEMFAGDFLDDCRIEQCPILIGVMRLFNEEKDNSVASDYEYKLLLEGDTLIQTQEKSTCQTVLNQLVAFKEEFDENEQTLFFNNLITSRLQSNIINEITKYLTLNEAVNTFSNNILQLQRQYDAKVHLFEPTDSFIRTILRKLKHDQIVSLRIDTDLFQTESQLKSLSVFSNVVSLTLLNFQRMNSIHQYEECFPRLIRLSLWYDNEVDSKMLAGIIRYMMSRLKRIEIHCPTSLCTHFFKSIYDTIPLGNTSIEYFLLDMADFPLPTKDDCFQHYETCFLLTTTDLIKNMNNIKYIRIITNKSNIEKLLDLNQWIGLVNVSYRLNTIVLQLLGNILEDEQLLKKIQNIQNHLRNIRQSIRFKVICK